MGGSYDDKTQHQTVKMDSSVFATPQSVDTILLVGMDLSTILSKATFSNYWAIVRFIDVNIKEVPKQLANLHNLEFVYVPVNQNVAFRGC